MGPEAIFPTVFYYVGALVIIGLLVGATVAGWGSLLVLVFGLASVAGVLNATFAPPSHGMFAGIVAFVAVFVVVTVFAAISHLIRRRVGRDKRTAV